MTEIQTSGRLVFHLEESKADFDQNIPEPILVKQESQLKRDICFRIFGLQLGKDESNSELLTLSKEWGYAKSLLLVRLT